MKGMSRDPVPKPHWYRLTPDRLVIGLLLVECLLILSGWHEWFAFNQSEGWAVLIDAASLELALLLLLRFVVALLCRLQVPFSFSSLLVIAVAGGCIWLPGSWEKARNQREAVAAIERVGGQVLYDYELDEKGERIDDATPPGSIWLRRLFDKDFFRTVAAVGLPPVKGTDEAMKYVGGLSQLRSLSVSGENITDLDLRQLDGLTTLRRLRLKDTAITDKGLESLHGLTDLQDLDLSETQITDQGLEHLKLLTKLRGLHLGGTKITDDGLKYLKGMTDLEELDIGACQVTNDGIKYLKMLPHLRSLKPDGTRITGDGVVELRRSLPGFKISGAGAAHELRGRGVLSRKICDQAIAEFNEALKFDPECDFAYANRGLAWYWKKNFAKALADDNECLRLNPSNAIALANRGGVWDDLKQYDKAIPDCDEAIKLNPRCVFAYDNRGIAWMHKGQLDKALADFGINR